MKYAVILTLLVVSGCNLTDAGSGMDSGTRAGTVVSPALGPVPFPAHNPWSAEKAELGRTLFFDPRLSADGSVSCASCHFPDRAFSDPRPVSLGVEGRPGLRNSPGLVNVAWEKTLFRDGGVFTLEAQVLAPLESHVEMDIPVQEVLDFLRTDADYDRIFRRVYGRPADVQSFTGAIATFERTIRSGGSPYDAHVNGNPTALSDAAVRGLELFSVSGCADCHSGDRFTSDGFEHNGLNVTAADSGRARITLLPDDYGRFKVPSLRNVGMTAPYMHDGRHASLRDVLEHYRKGGDAVRGQSDRIRPLPLTDADLLDLEAFLHALTDISILEGPDEPID